MSSIRIAEQGNAFVVEGRVCLGEALLAISQRLLTASDCEMRLAKISNDSQQFRQQATHEVKGAKLLDRASLYAGVCKRVPPRNRLGRSVEIHDCRMPVELVEG